MAALRKFESSHPCQYKYNMTLDELIRNNFNKNDVNLSLPNKKIDKELLPFKINDRYNVIRILNNGKILIYVLNKKETIAKLSLIKEEIIHLFDCYIVGQVGVKEKYQGQSIGSKLYAGLISIMNMAFIASESQSAGSRKLWVKLAESQNINVYGYSKRHNIFFNVRPNKNNTELEPNLTKIKMNLYNQKNSGLIAVKANSNYDKILFDKIYEG